MTTTTADPTTTTTFVHRVYIKAPAEKIWQAITDPEWTVKYGYGGYVHYDLKPGGKLEVNPDADFKAASEAQGYPCPDVLIDGEVIEVDPPHKLVSTWRMRMDPTIEAEGFTTLTHEIKELEAGYCSLTLIHDLTGAPTLFGIVSGATGDTAEGAGAGGGHAWVLSDLKSLLETGAGLAG